MGTAQDGGVLQDVLGPILVYPLVIQWHLLCVITALHGRLCDFACDYANAVHFKTLLQTLIIYL